MKRTILAVLLALAATAAPAAAQDWARVFGTTVTGEPRYQLLVLDPDADRADSTRYRRVPLGAVGLAAWAGATLTGQNLTLTPSSPTWNLLLFTAPAELGTRVQPVRARIGAAPVSVFGPDGTAVRWSALDPGALHIMIRDADGRLVLVR